MYPTSRTKERSPTFNEEKLDKGQGFLEPPSTPDTRTLTLTLWRKRRPKAWQRIKSAPPQELGIYRAAAPSDILAIAPAPGRLVLLLSAIGCESHARTHNAKNKHGKQLQCQWRCDTPTRGKAKREREAMSDAVHDAVLRRDRQAVLPLARRMFLAGESARPRACRPTIVYRRDLFPQVHFVDPTATPQDNAADRRSHPICTISDLAGTLYLQTSKCIRTYLSQCVPLCAQQAPCMRIFPHAYI